MACRLMNLSDQDTKLCIKFANIFGTTFQIIDDVINLTS